MANLKKKCKKKGTKKEKKDRSTCLGLNPTKRLFVHFEDFIWGTHQVIFTMAKNSLVLACIYLDQINVLLLWKEGYKQVTTFILRMEELMHIIKVLELINMKKYIIMPGKLLQD